MASSSSSESEGTTPGDTTEPTEAPRSEAGRALDQVLSELQPPGAPTAKDVAGAMASVTEHAVTLRATRDAHDEAQALLAEVTETRKQASEEAERILQEARDAGERTRQELSGWAAAQRAKVDALVADLVKSANEDADTIRAEALRTSMAEAEETARKHVAEAAARARTDAEAIRGEAREVLRRAIELGESASETVTELTSTVSDLIDRLQGTSAAMAELLAENPAPEPTDTDTDTPDATEDAETTGAGDEETGEGGADSGTAEDAAAVDGPSEDDEAAGENADEAPTATGEGDDESDARDEADVDEPARADREPEIPTDRQLGSMFRRHGRRGH